MDAHDTDRVQYCIVVLLINMVMKDITYNYIPIVRLHARDWTVRSRCAVRCGFQVAYELLFASLLLRADGRVHVDGDFPVFL